MTTEENKELSSSMKDKIILKQQQTILQQKIENLQEQLTTVKEHESAWKVSFNDQVKVVKEAHGETYGRTMVKYHQIAKEITAMIAPIANLALLVMPS